MKLREVLFKINDLFNPSEVRRTKRLKNQWDKVSDIASITQDKSSAHIMQEKEEAERDELRAEMNMLLEEVASDINRIRDILNRLLMS
ncbi:hypothetical protein ACFLV4_06775 [Chloroflexota bacterium]